MGLNCYNFSLKINNPKDDKLVENTIILIRNRINNNCDK